MTANSGFGFFRKWHFEERNHAALCQWIFQVPVKGGRDYITPQKARTISGIYVGFFLPIGGWTMPPIPAFTFEPEKSIDSEVFPHSCNRISFTSVTDSQGMASPLRNFFAEATPAKHNTFSKIFLLEPWTCNNTNNTQTATAFAEGFSLEHFAEGIPIDPPPYFTLTWLSHLLAKKHLMKSPAPKSRDPKKYATGLRSI